MDGIGYGSLGRRYRSAKLAWACESDLPVCSQSGAKLPDWHQQGMSWQSYMRCCRLVNESDCIVWRLAAVGTIGLFAHCWFGSRGIISVCRPCRELCAVEVPFEEYYALILLVQLRQTSNRWFKLLFDSFSDARVVRHKCCLNLSVDLSSRMTGDAVQKHSRQALLEEDWDPLEEVVDFFSFLLPRVTSQGWAQLSELLHGHLSWERCASWNCELLR